MDRQAMRDYVEDRLDSAMREKLDSLTGADIREISVRILGHTMTIEEILYDHFEDKIVEQLREEYKDRTGIQHGEI